MRTYVRVESVYLPSPIAGSERRRRIYAYLLGLYLGDGHINDHSRGQPALRLTIDTRDVELARLAPAAMSELSPTRVTSFERPRHVRVLGSCWDGWLELFPQHGRGRKHQRAIALTPWQRTTVDRHTKEFLRGLIHSDGCRAINRFSVRLKGRVAEYEYPRYFFSNLSEDIRSLFCAACDRLGVRWTQSNHRNISISHRTSVALLDSFIGRKRGPEHTVARRVLALSEADDT